MSFFNFLNTKKGSAICLLIAFAYRIANVIYVSYTGKDKILLMLQSKNFLQGNGLALTQYFTTNIKYPIYDYTLYWPPGYPVLLAPFLKTFNYDLFWSTTSLDIVSVVLFIVVVRKLVIEIGLPLTAVNILTLIAGCFNYAFTYQSGPTDIPSFTLFLFGLLMLLKAISNDKMQYIQLFAASLFLFVPCAFRYSYPPLSIGAVVAVIFIGVYSRNKLLMKKGIVSFLLVSLMILALLVSLKTWSGSAGYIAETGRGFFPENFPYWTPFVLESFINAPFIISQLVGKLKVSVEQSVLILEIINVILFIGILMPLFFLFFKKELRQSDRFGNFVVIGFFISAATCISLSYLSITMKPQPGWGNYQGEPRYFSFINLYLQILFIGWIFLYVSWKRNIQKLVVVLFSVLLFIEVTHNIYFQIKASLNPDKYASPYEEPDYVYFIGLARTYLKNNPDADIYVAAENDEKYLMLANYLGCKGIYDSPNLIKGLPIVEKKTILILALYDDQLPAYQLLLSKQNTQLLHIVNQVNFFRIDILP